MQRSRLAVTVVLAGLVLVGCQQHKTVDDVPVYQSSGNYDRTVRKMGVRVASEGFADRAYNVDLSLVSRKLPGSLITDPQTAAAQAVRMAMDNKVKTLDGVDVDISVQTICCHGDTPGAQNIVRAVREALEKAGCQVKPLRDWLPKA